MFNIKSFKFLIPLLLLVFTGLAAQKTSFIIKEGNAELQNKIGSFKNQYLNGLVDGATTADSKVLISYLDLRNLKIKPQENDAYLLLKFKKDGEKNVIISNASWMIEFESLDESTTKVSIKLRHIIPDAKSAKLINTKKSTSTGKFENEIKDFLEN